jgi:hypothetical protein
MDLSTRFDFSEMCILALFPSGKYLVRRRADQSGFKPQPEATPGWRIQRQWVHEKIPPVNNLSASRIMMSSQLRNEDKRGAKRDHHHASYSDLVVDTLRRLPRRIRGAFLAIAQTSYVLLDVRALSIQVGVSYARSSAPGILRHAKSLTRYAVWRGSLWGLILNSFLTVIVVGAIVLILGERHGYYLDENEKIAKGMRTKGMRTLDNY